MKLRQLRKTKTYLQKKRLLHPSHHAEPFNLEEAYAILGNLRNTSAGMVALSLAAGYDPRVFMPDFR